MPSVSKDRLVLVVDDDPIQQSIIAALLTQRFQCRVLKAENGAEAARSIETAGAALSLVVLDLNMPEFDGIEFLSVLKDKQFDAPVILASGADSGVRRAADKIATVYGINLIGSVPKPLDFALFTALATSALAAAEGHGRTCGRPA